ncbi:MAG: hypothetical protein HXY35_13955 [Chloroflexi bacterium]|nr:hypothetical protein [Chloroflexota bacterium]
MKLSFKHYGIILTGLTTAFLHISLYSDFGYLDWIVLNGFGTIALLGAYFLPIPYFQSRHRNVFRVLAGYILLTILLWIIFGDKTFQVETTAATGYYAKIAEISMLAFMGFDLPKSKAG